MASTCRNHLRETNLDTLMRLLGIDLGKACVARSAAEYVEAVHICRQCQPLHPKCLDAPGHSLVRDPCPNARLLIKLMMDGLQRPEPGDMH